VTIRGIISHRRYTEQVQGYITNSVTDYFSSLKSLSSYAAHYRPRTSSLLPPQLPLLRRTPKCRLVGNPRVVVDLGRRNTRIRQACRRRCVGRIGGRRRHAGGVCLAWSLSRCKAAIVHDVPDGQAGRRAGTGVRVLADSARGLVHAS
jgi:hypothetical protein